MLQAIFSKRRTILVFILFIAIILLIITNRKIHLQQMYLAENPTVIPLETLAKPIIIPEETQVAIRDPDQTAPNTGIPKPDGVTRKIEPVTIVGLFGIVWLVEGWPLPNCDITCYFERDGIWGRDPALVERADGIIYYDIPQTTAYWNKNKVNMVFSSESFDLYPASAQAFTEGVTKGLFDAGINYHLETDKVVTKLKKVNEYYTHLTITYSPYLKDMYYIAPVPFKDKDPEALASIFVSNCGLVKSGRNSWIQELMKHITVHSFGRCYNNKRQEDRGCTQPHWDGKLCVIKQYKFYLAFENSIDVSYVTEKYWQTLYTGTVPVYIGAPNIHEFDPLYEPGPNGEVVPDWKPKSIIRVTDFKNAEELANFLKDLANDEERYNSYLAWKNVPPSPYFQKMINYTLDNDITSCRVCHYVADERERKKARNQG